MLHLPNWKMCSRCFSLQFLLSRQASEQERPGRETPIRKGLEAPRTLLRVPRAVFVQSLKVQSRSSCVIFLGIEPKKKLQEITCFRIGTSHINKTEHCPSQGTSQGLFSRFRRAPSSCPQLQPGNKGLGQK